MSEHLSSGTYNALVDGELSAGELAAAKEHLDGCAVCTSRALEQALLKTATAKVGKRYDVPQELEQRMRLLASQQVFHSSTKKSGSAASSSSGMWRPALAGWAVAAALLVSAGGLGLMELNNRRAETASMQSASLVAEVTDQHIATLANTLPPQVISSDRHTVKPWFQGKIPFSFNLPEALPAGTTLDGADLAYVHGRPAAQLLYSVGKHRVSIFLEERTSGAKLPTVTAEHSGYHVVGFTSGDLDGVAISDVDPAKLNELVRVVAKAQIVQ